MIPIMSLLGNGFDLYFTGDEAKHAYHNIQNTNQRDEINNQEYQTGKMDAKNYDPRLSGLINNYNSIYGNNGITSDGKKYMLDIRDLNERISKNPYTTPMTNQNVAIESKRIQNQYDPGFFSNPVKYTKNHPLMAFGGIGGTVLASGALYNYLKKRNQNNKGNNNYVR